MPTPVIMPKQGQSVESCVIIGWKKKPGDAVKAGEVICEVETDKATFEVESPAEGTLLAIFHEAGSDVPVLATIAAIGKPGESVDGLGTGSAGPAATAASPRSASPAAAPAAPAPSTAPEPAAGAKVMASPRAKALAASRGVTLAGLRGSGPGGRIIERDVQAAAPEGTARAAAAPQRTPGTLPAAAAAAPTAAGEFKEIRVTGIRKLISERMLASLQTTAQLTLNAGADARSLQDMRRKFKESAESLRLRDITVNDMILFAVSRALLSHPDLNALYAGDTLRQYAAVHLAFAVDTPRGLMVPVIRNAHSLRLREIAQEARRLAGGCRSGGVTPNELAGGTFTVTNLGALGVQSFTPVLNAPQVGILGVGSIVPGPVLAPDGSVSFIPQIGLSLTVNHQVVDGAPGARFLQTLAEDIARFDLLLAR
jgi:pyruvate dehydrogenase E2 component (dihydrolipoamide acetyltransferase)